MLNAYGNWEFIRMIFVAKEHYFSNGWDCRKCGKMTEHLKEGRGKDAKLICVEFEA